MGFSVWVYATGFKGAELRETGERSGGQVLQPHRAGAAAPDGHARAGDLRTGQVNSARAQSGDGRGAGSPRRVRPGLPRPAAPRTQHVRTNARCAGEGEGRPGQAASRPRGAHRASESWTRTARGRSGVTRQRRLNVRPASGSTCGRRRVRYGGNIHSTSEHRRSNPDYCSRPKELSRTSGVWGAGAPRRRRRARRTFVLMESSASVTFCRPGLASPIYGRTGAKCARWD